MNPHPALGPREIASRFALACLILTPLVIGLGQVFLRTTGVPPAYPPLSPLPILSGVVGGSLICALGYAFLQALIPDRRALARVYAALGVLLLVASFNLPWRLSYTKSPRFAGVTAAAQVSQGLLHTVVVGVNLLVFTRRAGRQAGLAQEERAW